jgi:hypothetical protein
MKPRTCTNASKLMQVAKENTSEAKKRKEKKKEEKIKTGKSRRTHRHLGFEDKKKRKTRVCEEVVLATKQNSADRQTDRQTE